MITRGEVRWALMPPPTGSGPGFRRPVVIVQADRFNASKISSVVVVGITSNRWRAEAPGNVLLSTKDSGLRRESVANVSQLFTLDRSVVEERVGRLPARIMRKVEDGLRLVLDLAG